MARRKLGGGFYERRKVAHRGYLITDASPMGHSGEGPFWIEKDGIVVYRSAKSVDEAKRIIENDLAG